MAKWRTVLQPSMRVTANQNGDPRFAIETGSAKSVLIWINIFENLSSTAPSFKILGASQTNVKEDISSAPFWLTLATLNGTPNTAGALSATITNPPAVLRWSVSGIAGAVGFEIIADMWDV